MGVEASTFFLRYNNSVDTTHMNIFVVDKDPIASAKLLPDRHVTKMILESAQMISLVFSSHYWDIGKVMKVDGTPFKTEKGAFKKHPCTIWAADNTNNCAWLLEHAYGLTTEFTHRYNKLHGLTQSILDSKKLFNDVTGSTEDTHHHVTKFARAMPDEWKLDSNLDDVSAYRLYVNSKPWVYDNYLRDPSRRPHWITQPTLNQ